MRVTFENGRFLGKLGLSGENTLVTVQAKSQPASIILLEAYPVWLNLQNLTRRPPA
jgi:hypothetical protein